MFLYIHVILIHHIISWKQFGQNQKYSLAVSLGTPITSYKFLHLTESFQCLLTMSFRKQDWKPNIQGNAEKNHLRRLLRPFVSTSSRNLIRSSQFKNPALYWKSLDSTNTFFWKQKENYIIPQKNLFYILDGFFVI